MSARRASRGRSAAPSVEVDGIAVPPALLDGADPLWSDRERYLDWLSTHGLSRLSPRDRLPEVVEWLRGASGDAHPANRRSLAAEEWAEANGIALDNRFDTPRADWRELRRLGLID
jgi:hypothetical protein